MSRDLSDLFQQSHAPLLPEGVDDLLEAMVKAIRDLEWDLEQQTNEVQRLAGWIDRKDRWTEEELQKSLNAERDR